MSLTGRRTIIATVASASLLAGCWSSPAHPVVVAGMRMVDDQPEFWAGAECSGVGEVAVEVPGESEEEPAHSWSMTAQEATASLETFVVGEPPSGFSSDDPAPEWPTDGTLRVRVYDENGRVLGSFLWQLDTLAGSGDHPDEWYADGHGWVDEDEFGELVDEGPGGYYPFCEIPEG